MKKPLTTKEAWLVLTLIPGLGRSSLARLIAHFENPVDVITASKEEIEQVEGLNPKLAAAICEYDYRAALDAELRLMERCGAEMVTVADDLYPENLRHIFDPPPLLFIKGELKPSDKYAIALVGARKCSRYGRIVSEDLARQLAEKGIVVVSGMARGIDSAAHRGALNAGGRTLAVLGCGLSVVYPPENRELMEEISRNGAVISEFSMAAAPAPYNFPVRNRIISGLCLGSVVVEASSRSGASITAGCALEQGREVFAVPGSINSPVSRGTHRLIKQGAKLVERVDDILEELQPQFSDLITEAVSERAKEDFPEAELTPEEAVLLEVLSYDPVYLDEIVMNSELPPQKVLGLLMGLEMKNKVIQSPGQMYSLR